MRASDYLPMLVGIAGATLCFGIVFVVLVGWPTEVPALIAILVIAFLSIGPGLTAGLLTRRAVRKSRGDAQG